ncbi:hypothetical protein J5N97_025450 [Dioscorea zingiberensis]|uniref:Uncharacterized protein n=1 Tax=Dioscorea zingiberensis TaxID=325984 RepID=A0A9D5C927_9LILI|nr:hypothetical protein J5N97_025450 [Dioscorea zingiberensis]
MKVPCREYASSNSKRKPVRNSRTIGTKKRSQEQTMELVDKLVDLSTPRSIIAEELKSKDDSCSYRDCIDKLTSLLDIPDEELFIEGKALRSRKDRIIFMKMLPSAQSYWLHAYVKEWLNGMAEASTKHYLDEAIEQFEEMADVGIAPMRT